MTTGGQEEDNANRGRNTRPHSAPSKVRRPVKSFNPPSREMGGSTPLTRADPRGRYDTAAEGGGHNHDRDRPSTSSEDTEPVAPSPSPIRNGYSPRHIGWEEEEGIERRDPQLELLHKKCD